MALPALCCHYLTRSGLKHPKTQPAAAFAAGLLSILFSGLLTALALSLSDKGFLVTAKAVVLAHLPIMVIEGFITMFVVGFITKVQPEILQLQPVAIRS
jgi:cobalt/nickel transport system permease protein